MDLRWKARLTAVTTACFCCGVAHAQSGSAQSSPPSARTALPAPASADDMAMPDDLGAPLPQATPTAAASETLESGADMAMPDDLGAPLAGATAPAPTAGRHILSVDQPIAQIASNPQGKAALERALPGLCERAEYPMFKSMSLKKLAGMSSGRITTAKLDAVQADLTRIGPVDGTGAPAHGALYPLTHTAAYSIHYGGKQIGHISRSIYHRVVLVIAAL